MNSQQASSTFESSPPRVTSPPRVVLPNLVMRHQNLSSDSARPGIPCRYRWRRGPTNAGRTSRNLHRFTSRVEYRVLGRKGGRGKECRSWISNEIRAFHLPSFHSSVHPLHTLNEKLRTVPTLLSNALRHRGLLASLPNSDYVQRS